MKKSTLFGLLDCNNFYVSCERVFNPALENKPVIILSSNDGCVISRSNEAKSLGIKMGEPIFKIRNLVEQWDVKVFSSNFTLYGDLSERVMHTLTQFIPEMEIYSIDEAFLNFTGFHEKERQCLAETLVKTIFQWTGIPVSLGIGPTKTLAKIANRIAKKNKQTNGVFEVTELNVHHILNQTQIEEVWGIGRRWGYRLNQMRIQNALQLSQQNVAAIQKQFNTILASTILELKGEAVYDIETNIKPKKQIMSSCSFGKNVTDITELKEAIASHTTRSLEELREQGSIARTITVFLETNRFQTPNQEYHFQTKITLPFSSQDTKIFLKTALQGLDKIYCKHKIYKKAGIVLSEISQEANRQLDLFYEPDINSEKRMKLLDSINYVMGKGTLRFAVEGYKKFWHPRKLNRSPRYTTDWSELLKVKAN